MTEPTTFPPRRRPAEEGDPTRRLDAVEMDRLAKDARGILEKAAGDRTLGGDNDEAYRTAPQKSAPIRTGHELNNLGRMSAEAVNEQYEAAAKAFEDMAPEVKQRVASIAGALLELDADLKTIAEMAAAIRDKGKRVQLQIEEASALSNDIRDAALDVKKRLGL